MAVSSYCRECCEYFRIENGRPVIKEGPRISGISEVHEYGSSSDGDEENEKEVPTGEDTHFETVEPGTADTWLRSSGGRNRPKSRPLTSGSSTGEPDSAETGAGAFFGLADDSKAVAATGDEEPIGKEAKPKDELAQGSMSELIGDIVERNEFGADITRMPANFVHQEKKPENKRKHAKEIEVRCFRCNHRQNVTRYAASTQCGRCSVYISMSDYEIKGLRKNVLRTRGNVTVTRRGSVIDTELACHDFTSYGLVSAQLDCSGDVTFKHSGKISGPVHCQHLMVGKKCEIEFPDGVVAERADIYGTVRGNITCRKSITVHKRGLIEGDARAEQIDTKGSGKISGKTSLEQDIDIAIPTKTGFNSSIID